MAAGPIAVYGATGYTGTLVAREVRRRGLPLVLSGRDPDKLARLAAELGGGVPTRPAHFDDVRGLRRALEDCAAVVNCAGPFTRLGEPVVRAAVESGTHYLDTAGEQTFMKRVVEEFDDAARAAGVAVIPAMGFDYVPGDLLCALVARGREPLEEVVVAYAVEGFGPSRGTMRSTVEILRGGGVEYRGGEWRPAARRPGRATFSFPEPLGRQPVVRFPSGEVVTVPRHLRTRAVTTLMATRALAPHPALAPAVGVALPAMSAALRTPLSRALSAAIARLPEGPDEAARQAAAFTVAAVARGEDASIARGVVRGHDVYGLTAVIAVHGASLAAAGLVERAGVLSAATAFDPAAFLDHLGQHGVEHELDPVARPTRAGAGV